MVELIQVLIWKSIETNYLSVYKLCYYTSGIFFYTSLIENILYSYTYSYTNILDIYFEKVHIPNNLICSVTTFTIAGYSRYYVCVNVMIDGKKFKQLFKTISFIS